MIMIAVLENISHNALQTFVGHADGDTFVEATELTSVSADPHYQTTIRVVTFLVGEIVTNSPSEEAL